MNFKKLFLIALIGTQAFAGRGSAAFGGFLGGFFTGNLLNNIFRPSRQVVIVEKNEPRHAEKIIIQNQIPTAPVKSNKETELKNLELELIAKEKELLERERELMKRERKFLEREQNQIKNNNEKNKNISCILNIAE
jgi:hypothetical protein